MKNIIYSSVSVIKKCLAHPIYVATGCSWNRILFADNSPAVMPVKHSDGQLSIDGDSNLLQVMASSPLMYDALETALKELNVENPSPKQKCNILKIKIAIATANNTHGFNNDFINEMKVDMFKAELSLNAYRFHQEEFINSYEENEKVRLSPDQISQAIDNLHRNIKYTHLWKRSFYSNSYLELQMFSMILELSPHKEIMVMPTR